MKVSMPSVRTLAPNVTVVQFNYTTIWFSYETPIGFRFGRLPQVIMSDRLSTTTSKHQKLITSGHILYANLQAFGAIWDDFHTGILADMIGEDDPASDAACIERIKELIETHK